MAYKYINLGLPGYPTSQKEQLRNGFQALLYDQFYNTTSIQTIYEEVNFGSNTFSQVDVRVNRAINSATGEKRGDDFKNILFSDLDHSTSIGYKYYFNDNYWIVVFSEIIMSLGTSCMVRRCNEFLRWMTPDGTYYEEPCAIEYKISRPRDTSGAENPVVPAGFVDVYAQLNSRTELIKGNQRFLFGRPNNRLAFRVFGNAVQSMMNQITTDDASSKLLTLTMGGNYVNKDTDDIVSGIADRYEDYGNFTSASQVGNYSIIVDPPTNAILESGSGIYNVKYYSNGLPVSGSFIFSVSGSVVPSANYTFTSIDANNFSIVNNKKWLSDTLDIVASGTNGSRTLNFNLKGAW